MCVCVCVCVRARARARVCVREREKGGERERNKAAKQSFRSSNYVILNSFTGVFLRTVHTLFPFLGKNRGADSTNTS